MAAPPLLVGVCQLRMSALLADEEAFTSWGAPGTVAPPPPPFNSCSACAQVNTTSVGAGPQAPTTMPAKAGPYDEPDAVSPVPMYCSGCAHPLLVNVPRMTSRWPQQADSDPVWQSPLGELVP